MEAQKGWDSLKGSSEGLVKRWRAILCFGEGRDTQSPAIRQGCNVPAAAFSPGAWHFLGVPQESSRRRTVALTTKPHCCLAGSCVLTTFPSHSSFHAGAGETYCNYANHAGWAARGPRGRGAPLPNCFLSWSNWLSAWVPRQDRGKTVGLVGLPVCPGAAWSTWFVGEGRFKDGRQGWVDWVNGLPCWIQ